MDQEYPGRVLLAEANQWPHDVVEYFGDGPIGDECHMAFHFPLMPRLFMSLKEESAQSVIDILANTPAIPESGQWGIFLRNHDELTLEMVNDVERAFMYEHYAQNPRMRSNVGITGTRSAWAIIFGCMIATGYAHRCSGLTSVIRVFRIRTPSSFRYR